GVGCVRGVADSVRLRGHGRGLGHPPVVHLAPGCDDLARPPTQPISELRTERLLPRIGVLPAVCLLRRDAVRAGGHADGPARPKPPRRGPGPRPDPPPRRRWGGGLAWGAGPAWAGGGPWFRARCSSPPVTI